MSDSHSISQNFNGTLMLRVFLPDELITEVLSFLPVKSLMRLRCVCKSWNTLMYDPIFVKLHLKRSSTNSYLALFSLRYDGFTLTCYSPSGLRHNTPVFVADNPNLHLNDSKGYFGPVGSCNGLLCLLCYKRNDIFLYIWNPATRTLSNKIVFPEFDPLWWKFVFSYDISTETYKIVAFNSMGNDVKVFSLGDNIWRNIQSFPIVPIIPRVPHSYPHIFWDINNGVHVSGTLNWLAIRNDQFLYEHQLNWNFITVDQFVIISLDLSTETYHRLLPPGGFNKVPRVQPTLAMLMDSLCFSHDFQGTDLTIWQMKEFGVQESWTQLFKISYQSLQINYKVLPNLLPYGSQLLLFPLCLYENDNTLMLAWNGVEQVIVYNLKDNRVEETGITNKIDWSLTKNYVESLVSIA